MQSRRNSVYLSGPIFYDYQIWVASPNPYGSQPLEDLKATDNQKDQKTTERRLSKKY